MFPLINLKELPLIPETLKEQSSFSFSETAKFKSSFDIENSNYLVWDVVKFYTNLSVA